jgi:hypothetical protein
MIAINGEAPRCKLCGRYISRWCDYLDCPHVRAA